MPKVQTKKFLLLSLMLGPLALTACAERPKPAVLQVTVGQQLREPCARTPRPAADTLTVGKLADFSVAQEGDISACDATRQAAVELLDKTNLAIVQAHGKKKPWWEVW